MPNGSYEQRPSGMFAPRGQPGSDPSQAAESVTPPGEQPSSTAMSPIGRFGQRLQGMNQNISQRQFQPGSRAHAAAIGAIQGQQTFNFFRHAGMGAAVRFAVGLPQVPDQVVGLYRAQAVKNLAGVNPGFYVGQHTPGPGRSDRDEFYGTGRSGAGGGEDE
jgi:hypothetical protein